MGTKNNPGAYDCYANAHPDEPMFVLLGRDKFGASLVELWAAAREADAEKPDKVTESRDVVAAMKNWLYTHRKEAVDVLDMVPYSVLAEALQRRGATVTPAAHAGDEAPLPVKGCGAVNPGAAWPFHDRSRV